MPAPSPTVERHVQTVVGFLITAVLGWVGWTLNSVEKEQVRQIEKVVQLELQVARLSGKFDEATDDRYRRRDAEKDLSVVNSALSNLRARLEKQERLMDLVDLKLSNGER